MRNDLRPVCRQLRQDILEIHIISGRTGLPGVCRHLNGTGGFPRDIRNGITEIRFSPITLKRMNRRRTLTVRRMFQTSGSMCSTGKNK